MIGHELIIRLGDRGDLEWAQQTVVQQHYLRSRVHRKARPFAYVVEHAGQRVGLVMIALPHATRCRGWWGYPGLPTQWQVVDLCRIWLSPDIQRGGQMCHAGIVPGFHDRRGNWQSAAATWAIREVMGRIQQDWVSLNPPVYPAQPYHVELVISYHDPQFHDGTIYRQSQPPARPMYTDASGQPAPGSSGKFGWCWQLAAPAWSWGDIEILRPRTMRML